jgi:hypothetical protein
MLNYLDVFKSKNVLLERKTTKIDFLEKSRGHVLKKL